MAPKKGNKTPQPQKNKKDKEENKSKNPTGSQTTQTADIKEIFQQLQLQSPRVIQAIQTPQDISDIAETSGASRSSGEIQPQHPRSSSLIDTTGSGSDPKELEKENWDMRKYIQSLPTREDMDQYVFRLENSYKKEVLELKVSIKNTQEKTATLDTKLSNVEQESIKLKENIHKQGRQIHHLINSIDEQENRSRRSNIRIRG